MNDVEHVTPAEFLANLPGGRKRSTRKEVGGKGRWRCGRCGAVLECSADLAERHINGEGGGALHWLDDA